MFATRLLESSEMPAKPDLASHTLIHFLDRFVYRNAKAAASGLRGNSIMQPLAGGDSRGVLVSNKSTQSTEPVNSESFWRKKAEDVAVDEVFFHKYFSQIGKSKKASAKKAKHDKAADADEGDENEDEIWQALVDSRPEVEGPSDDDSDLEMLDLDDSEDGSSVDGGVDIQSEDGLDGDSDDYEDVDSEGSDGEGVIFGDDEDVDSDDEEQELSKLVETKSEKETSRSRKKRMKALPTFASADDYAEMLEQNDGEDF
jgi:ribosome biogenesis protein MAK21